MTNAEIHAYITRADLAGIRRRAGLTQAQLAERVGCKTQRISNWERRLYTPRGADGNRYALLLQQLAVSHG